MVKILNTVLCLGCIAGIIAIIATHNGTAAADETGATAYFGGGSNWTTVNPNTTGRIPGNPFIAGSRDDFTGNELTEREKSQGLKRWNELRDLANAQPTPTPGRAATLANANSPRLLRKAKKLEEARRRAYLQKKNTGSSTRRRSRSFFQQTRHFEQYESTYRNPNKSRRRGLPADRRARSRSIYR